MPDLTDAELDAELDNCPVYDGPCRHCDMAVELRALREQLQDVEDALVGADVDVAGELLADGVRRLREQNAAMKAEVERQSCRAPALWAEMFPGKAFPGDRAAIQHIADRRGDYAALVTALEAITRRVPIMGSSDEYRRGQLDALEACREVARDALARVRGAE